jgi:hypothetical protein
MASPIMLTPIGVVRGGRTEIFEDHWGPVVAQFIRDPLTSRNQQEAFPQVRRAS